MVLAHELGHHVHGDIWKGIAFEGGLMVGGFSSPPGCWAPEGRAVWRVPPIPAGCRCWSLRAGRVAVMLPAAYALSRTFERSANRFALELTRNPARSSPRCAGLARKTSRKKRPSRRLQWLFYSHPPVAERIAAAQAFKRPT